MSEEKIQLLQKIERLQNELNDALCFAASRKMVPELEIHRRNVTHADVVEQIVINLNVNLKGF